MGKLLLASLVAALAMMAWAFLFWTTPIAGNLFGHPGPAEDLLRSALAALPESGAYFVPDMPEGGDMEAWKARHRAGPIAHLHVIKGGAEPMPPTQYVWGLLHMLVTALILAFMLRMALPVLDGYAARVGFVVLAGLAAAVWGQLGQPIWFLHGWGYHILYALYDWISWLLAGLVLGAFIKPAS